MNDERLLAAVLAAVTVADKSGITGIKLWRPAGAFNAGGRELGKGIFEFFLSPEPLGFVEQVVEFIAVVGLCLCRC